MFLFVIQNEVIEAILSKLIQSFVQSFPMIIWATVKLQQHTFLVKQNDNDPFRFYFLCENSESRNPL